MGAFEWDFKAILLEDCKCIAMYLNWIFFCHQTKQQGTNLFHHKNGPYLTTFPLKLHFQLTMHLQTVSH